MMLIGKPCLMHHSSPGDTRSLTLSTLSIVILSPGDTSAYAAPAASSGRATSPPSISCFIIVVRSPLSFRCLSSNDAPIGCGGHPAGARARLFSLLHGLLSDNDGTAPITDRPRPAPRP